jgi:serine/threonine-protein kinase RsbT
MAMAAETRGEVPIQVESDIVVVRKTIRSVANQLGFGITDVTRIVTAASELGRNIVLYAGAGMMRWCALNTNGRIGIELVFSDRGPGISDVRRAMLEGYSTSGGLGMGLPGSRRLMDELEICSEIGKGTTVTVRKWRRT